MLNESKIKQARHYFVSAKDPPTFIGETASVRFKLDEKRRLRSGDLR